MLSNYYTLRHIAHDLHDKLAGSAIEEIFSQNKNELIIAFSGKHFLLCSCDPSMNHCFLRTTYARAKKNTISFFPRMTGAVVRSVTLHPSDREMTILTDRPERLLLRFYGAKANVLLVDQQRTILDSFLRPKELIASTAEAALPPRPFPSTPSDFHAQLSAIGHLSVFSAFKSMAPLLGTLIVRELFARASVDEHRTAAEVSDSQAEELFKHARSLEADLSSDPSPRIYSDRGRPVCFALVELRQFSSHQSERFESIHDAIRVFLSTSFREKGFHAERDHAIAKLKAEKEKIQRTTEKIAREEEESVERMKVAELRGKLLMAHLHTLQRGDDAVLLENVFSPQREEIRVPLDPHVSPAKNAERYFDKARKARQALDDQARHRDEYNERYEEVVRLLASLEPVQTAEQWRAFAEAHGKAIGLREGGGSKKKEKESVPFRVFTVEGGFEVWAGKSSENNDLLTTKHARPNDLWFHARGAGGSHVVLRLGTGKGEISRRAKEQAASIAAFYSKMKNAKLVPVAMTERKYVHKRKGSPAGTVTVEREKVLMVPPGLPAEKS